MGRLMRMGCCSIASMSCASVTPGASSCSSVKIASLVRTALITGSPVAAISATSVARSGGVLRYSMTSGSTPLFRIMASVLRDVPHLGL